jgi:lipopolysaccharide export system protein LptA
MELKIETIIILAITVIVTGAMTLEIDNKTKKNEVFTKELEFTNTTITEVGTQKLQGRAYGTYGVRDNGVLYLENIVYFTETIKYLIADKGKYIGDVLHLDGNIILEEQQGYNYRTQQASYDQNTEILNVTAPFVATSGKNIFKGDTLVYHTQKKEAYGTAIDAVVYTAEK